MKRVGFLVFPKVEELDLVGPWQVLTTAAAEAGDLECLTVGESVSPIRASKRLAIVPDATFENAPSIDVILVPGGAGVDSERFNPTTLDWIRRTSATCEWVTSVCSGAILLLEAGPARRRRITSHDRRLDAIEKGGLAGEVVRNERYVLDGNVVTSAGVSAGIDMALAVRGRQLSSSRNCLELR